MSLTRSSLVCAAFAFGCASSPNAPPRASGAETKPPTQIDVERQVVTPGGASSLSELFEQARRDFDAERFADSAKGFERVYQLEQSGPLASHALFNAGHARDEAGELASAFGHYRRVLSEFPSSPLFRDALVRAVRVGGFLESWSEAGRLAEIGLERFKDLGPFEAVSLRSARAMALLETGDLERASYHIEQGRTVVETSQLDRAGKLPAELAQLFFALGELRRQKGEAIVFTPTPKNFGQVLEERCQLLLDAQSAYSDTMRAYDSHWSAMAGYRVGELYQRLHEELMRVPPPAGADTEARRQLFEGAMRLRYSVLLKKGLQLMTHTLSMANRTGERSSWVKRAAESKTQLELAMKREDAALDRLPFTRAQLRTALDELAEKYKAPPP